MSKEETFICPFCGAPYRRLIPAGKVQVKCQYCKSTILVPPRLGGVVQRCPNHPDVLAVGLCNNCGRSYCDRCLYIERLREGGRLHLCAECYEKRKKMGGVLMIPIIILALLFGLFFPEQDPAGLMARVISLICGIILVPSTLYYAKKKPDTVHNSKQI